MGTAVDGRAQTSFYCSTSGSWFTDKEQLAEHYRSELHRYNLKRKVGGCAVWLLTLRAGWRAV
jgi:hypothetical protein